MSKTIGLRAQKYVWPATLADDCFYQSQHTTRPKRRRLRHTQRFGANIDIWNDQNYYSSYLAVNGFNGYQILLPKPAS